MINNSSNVTVDPDNYAEWSWPVPLLLGGLGAVLAFVPFALIILPCSYWKTIDSQNNERNLNASVEFSVQNEISSEGIEEDKVVVIMAGQRNPTFLARPASGSEHKERSATGQLIQI